MRGRGALAFVQAGWRAYYFAMMQPFPPGCCDGRVPNGRA
jgi:hypothetical protein